MTSEGGSSSGSSFGLGLGLNSLGFSVDKSSTTKPPGFLRAPSFAASSSFKTSSSSFKTSILKTTPYLPSDVRLGEKRFGQKIHFTTPRRLDKLFSAETEDGNETEANQGAGSNGSPQPDLRDSSRMPRTSTASRSIARSPERYTAAFRRLDGLPLASRTAMGSLRKGTETSMSSRPGALVANLESLTKKRKMDGLASADTSLNGSSNLCSPVRTTEVIKLETEVKRLTFERDSATKMVELERMQIETKIRQRQQEEEATNAKTAEMWSQAEKIMAENDRLKEKYEKAETEAITSRKKYEDQIATLRTENMDKMRLLDKDLREVRTENLGLAEKLKSCYRDRDILSEENRLLKDRMVSFEQTVTEFRSLKRECQALKVQLQTKDGQIDDLTNANALLSNLPEEMRQYRELQVTVPLLQKENLKLREKAALARANEDKIQTLEETVKRYESRLQQFYDLELENDHLKNQMKEWDSSESLQSPTKKPEGIQKLLDRVAELESARKNIGNDLSSKNQRIFELNAQNGELERQIAALKSTLETSEASRSRFEQSAQETSSRLHATQTERDTLRLIKETIDAGNARRDPAVQAKVRDLEDRILRSQTRADNFEHLYHQSQASETEVKGKYEELQRRYEAETVRSHEILQSLTKENEDLRKGKEELEQTSSEDWAVRQRRGEYDPATTQIFTLEDSPADMAQKKFLEDAAKAMEENKLLHEKLNQVRASGTYPSDLTMSAEEFLKGPGEQLDDLRAKLEKMEKQRNRDIATFKRESGHFRTVARDLLGWNVRIDTNKVVFRVPDAPQNEVVIFEREDEASAWELKPSQCAKIYEVYVNEFLHSHQSPPGFLARIVLKVLQERTLVCLDSTPT